MPDVNGVPDLTGAIYSLIVVSSATLAVSQYLYAQLKVPTDNVRDRLKTLAKSKDHPLCNVLENKTKVPKFEGIAKEYDDLSVEQFRPLVWEMVVLFLVLLASSFLQAFNVIIKVWGLPIFGILASLILVAYVLVTTAIAFAGWKLYKMRRHAHDYNQSIDTLITTADTFWDIYKSGGKSVINP